MEILQAGTASDYFGSMVASYDSLIRRAVPGYEEITACLVRHLPTSAARVLELGCGTGNLSLALAARYPEAELTLVDAAPEMVGLARARLAALAPASEDRGRFVTARFEELRLPARAFDLVASSFSLHHVLDKGALFRSIRTLLRPGGTLRFADQLRGGSERVHATFWSDWLAFCRQPGHCTEEEIRGLLDHAERHDHYVSLAEHFRLLEDAGFASVDCVWRGGMWAVVTADRPGRPTP
jgi:tRNA (cmo5U34)-methyltransferase